MQRCKAAQTTSTIYASPCRGGVTRFTAMAPRIEAVNYRVVVPGFLLGVRDLTLVNAAPVTAASPLERNGPPASLSFDNEVFFLILFFLVTIFLCTWNHCRGETTTIAKENGLQHSIPNKIIVKTM